MIRHANAVDIDEIMRIVEDTKKIMHAQGNVQWDESYPLCADFERDIANGSLYIIEVDSAVAGFVCLDFNEPDAYKTAGWHKPKPALVLHRMAVDPLFRGHGVGGNLLEFAEQKAAELAAGSVRTDTFSGNAPMNALFLKHGYRMTGAVELPGRRKQPFNCYEK